MQLNIKEKHYTNTVIITVIKFDSYLTTNQTNWTVMKHLFIDFYTICKGQQIIFSFIPAKISVFLITVTDFQS